MKKNTILWTGAIVIILILSALLYHHYSIEKPDVSEKALTLTEEKQTVVTVQKMQAIPLVVSQTYIGFVIPIHSVEIRPFIAGFIDEVKVKGGEFVTADQPLFTLEQSQYVADMDLKMASVISSAAEFENAKTYYERLKVAGNKAVSSSDLDAAKAKFLTAGAAVGAAVAGYDAAQVMYNYTFVNAPITGVLGNVSVTKGQYVSPQGAPLAYLVQTTPMRVVFSISNSTYLQGKAVSSDDFFSNKKVRLKLADGRFYDVTGKVQFLDNTITATTSSVQVYADFDNVDRTLLPNAYVEVYVEEDKTDALTILQKFVTMTKDGYFVWVVGTDGKLQERKIEVADKVIDNSFYLVVGGLQSGDFVVTQKPAQIDVNNPVQIKMELTDLPHTYSSVPENSGEMQ